MLPDAPFKDAATLDLLDNGSHQRTYNKCNCYVKHRAISRDNCFDQVICQTLGYFVIFAFYPLYLVMDPEKSMLPWSNGTFLLIPHFCKDLRFLLKLSCRIICSPETIFQGTF